MQAPLRILLPTAIRFVAGVGGACLLLFLAAKARTESGLVVFLYVQHAAIVVATFAKIGVDTVIQADAERQFRLGIGGAFLLLGALSVGTCLMVGLGNLAVTLAVFSVSALTMQNALLVALAIRDADYLRGAWETVWTLPALLTYVAIRQEAVTPLEVAAVAGGLFATRLNHRFRTLLTGPAELRPMLGQLSRVWLFQLLNLLLFRLDQSAVSFLGARGRALPEATGIMFWAKANDLCNAVATALGGVANREESEKRALGTVLALRCLFPLGCVLAYGLAWLLFDPGTGKTYLLMGCISLASAGLAYEVNREAYLNMWQKKYNRLLGIWMVALATGLPLAIYGGAAQYPLLLPLAVLIQLSVATILLKTHGTHPAQSR